MAKLNSYLPSGRCKAEVPDYIGRWPHYEQCSNYGKFEVAVMSARDQSDAHVVKVCGNHKRVLLRGGLLSEITGPRRAEWPRDYRTKVVCIDKTKGDADEQAQPARENAAPGGDEAL